MDEMSNMPVTPAGSRPFYQVWLDALTKPNEYNFAEMANSSNASTGKAYLWVFLVSLVSVFVSLLISELFSSFGLQQAQRSNTYLIGLVCMVPIVAGLSVLGLIISAGLTQWVAGMFKGAGTFNQLVYVFGAISAPMTLISTVLSIFYSIPFLGLCLWPISILIFLYILLLEVVAVKGVNKFGWGPAIGSVLTIPALLFLCSCVVIVVLMLLGPAIGSTFSSINQSLGGSGY